MWGRELVLNSSFFLFLFSPKSGRYYYGVREGLKKKNKKTFYLVFRDPRGCSEAQARRQAVNIGQKKYSPPSWQRDNTGKQAKHNQSKPNIGV